MLNLAPANEMKLSPNRLVVLITGALTGIGKATAFAFAASDARVVLSGRNERRGNALAAEINTAGGEAIFIKADVSIEDEVKNLIRSTVSHFGRLDVAVNNAGTEGKVLPIYQQTIENYNHTFNTNVLGTVMCLKYQIQAMQNQGSGNIINISSSVADHGHKNLSVYSASKAAIDSLTKSAALEAAPLGIRVNAVAPGVTDTAMLYRLFNGNSKAISTVIPKIPMGRLASPDEIAQSILFLASDQSGYMNGHILKVDGGLIP